MDQDIEAILYRIVSGFYTINIDTKLYKIVSPNIIIKKQAHSIYTNVLDEYKYDTSSWVSLKVIQNLLKTYNIWDESKDKFLDESIKDLDKLKIQTYLNFNNQSIKNEIKHKILNLNDSINKLYSQKHHFDYLTLEHYAQTIKSQFLICATVLDTFDKPVFDFDNFDNIDLIFLEKIISHIQDHSVDINTIKKIARCETWKSFWGVSKENIFDGKIKDWTDEQRSLVNFSKILDNVREHMEAPSEDVISDDDALDGWILYQHEKNDKEKKKKEISDRYNLHDKNAGEIFLLSNDKQEKQTITNLNDLEGKHNMKEMIAFANQQESSVPWSEVPYVKRDLKKQLMELNKHEPRR